MKIIGDLVCFKSENTFYEAEKSGLKCCTLRVLDQFEKQKIGCISKIRIGLVGYEQVEFFDRTISWWGKVAN